MLMVIKGLEKKLLSPSIIHFWKKNVKGVAIETPSIIHFWKNVKGAAFTIVSNAKKPPRSYIFGKKCKGGGHRNPLDHTFLEKM